MKKYKFVKVFSLVVVLHMALVAMLVLQPGCNSVSGGDTVSMATPVGGNGYSDMWDMNSDKTPAKAQAQRSVKAVNQDLTPKSDFVSSQVAYSETDANDSFVDLAHAEFQTASVYSETGDHFEYKVQAGDSLWKIANKNGVSMRKVMAANNLKETDPIHPGQTLLIPGKAKAEVALAQLEVPSVKEVPVAKVEKKQVEVSQPVVAKAEPVAAPVKKETPVAPKKEVVFAQVAALSPAVMVEAETNDEGGIYEVAPGDSLYLIAMHNNTTIEEIRALNGLDKNLIKPGQQLRIPGKFKGNMELPAKKSPTTDSFAVAFNDVPVSRTGSDFLEHEVQPGEYPGLIARKYNMSLADLLHINNINNPRMLKVGSKLKVMNPDSALKQSQVATIESKSDEAVASNQDAETSESEGAVIPVDFNDFPVIRVGS